MCPQPAEVLPTDICATPTMNNKHGNYRCQKCGKSFSRKDYLTRHEFNHNKIKPFRCDTCNFAFTRSDLLAKHCKTKSHLNKLQNLDGAERGSSDGGIEFTVINEQQQLQRRSMSLSEIMVKQSSSGGPPDYRTARAAVPLSSSSSSSSSSPPPTIESDFTSAAERRENFNAIQDDEDEEMASGEPASNTNRLPGVSGIPAHDLLRATPPSTVLPPLAMHLGSIYTHAQNSQYGATGSAVAANSIRQSTKNTVASSPEESRHKMRIANVLNYD